MATISCTRIWLMSCTILLFSSTALWSQSHSTEAVAPAENTLGLHGKLSAQPGFYGDSRLETLTLCLSNNSDQTRDSSPESWVLVIDDKNVPDSGMMFLNGGAPAGGYKTVPPGHTFIFGKGLPRLKYFPEARNYRVYWKSASFRSNTVIVNGAN
jgi:hypothetical protein